MVSSSWIAQEKTARKLIGRIGKWTDGLWNRHDDGKRAEAETAATAVRSEPIYPTIYQVSS